MATKSAKKAAKKDAKKATTRGNLFQLSSDGKKKLAEITGQGKIVFDGLTKFEPVSSATLAEKIGAVFTTKQDPKRVVGFYLSQWKTDGYIKTSKSAAA